MNSCETNKKQLKCQHEKKNIKLGTEYFRRNFYLICHELARVVFNVAKQMRKYANFFIKRIVSENIMTRKAKTRKVEVSSRLLRRRHQLLLETGFLLKVDPFGSY